METAILRQAVFLLSALLLFASGCGTDQVGKVQPDIKVVPSHRTGDGENLLDYGKVPVLNRRTLPILVLNLGRAPLLIETLEFSGDDGAFQVDLPPNTTIPVGGELEIPVVFQPPSEDEFAARVTVHHNDKTKAPVDILLDGIGSTVGRVLVEPQLLDFGRVGEGDQEIRRFAIRSVGTAPLVVESVEIIEGGPEFFFLGSTQTPATLPAPADGLPGGEVNLSIACLPTSMTVGDDLRGKVLIRTTDPDLREVEVELVGSRNRAPVAVIEPTTGVPAPGDSIALDGSLSSDPDGDQPLQFFWRVVDKPHLSNAIIDDPTSPTPSLLTDVSGAYRVGLDVVDAAGLSCVHPEGNPAVPCAFRDIEVRAADDVVIELVWDEKLPDLDLHLIEGNGSIFSDRDCHWANPNPDFGAGGDGSDDPFLVRDALKGYGPERIVFSHPPEGQFKVSVVYAKTNGATRTNTNATLRLFIFGILAAEITQPLQTPGTRWDVLTFDWPSRTITELGNVSAIPQQ